MARDEDDDLYDEEFDFVDDDDDLDEDSDIDDESPIAEDEPAEVLASHERDGSDLGDDDRRMDEPDDEPVDEYGRPEPAANYVVHVYEHKTFKRTIDRPFTPEDAEAFATEFNRTGKSYGRVAVSGKNDTKPKKTLE
jgi:hypothetical protein